MLYARRFFRNKASAKDFQKMHGGALYANVPGSRSRKDYLVEAHLAGFTEADCEDRPYCVAWNIMDEGPIKPEDVI